MKLVRIAFVAAGIVLSAAAYSQTDTTKHPDPTKPGKPDTTKMLYSYASMDMNAVDTIVKPKPDTTKPMYSFASATITEAAETTVADTNGTQTSPQPNFGRYYIPVLGSYASSGDQNKNVTIQGDEQNPGKIWIEGLTIEKIYALRKTGAGTYKIPAQKAGDQNVAEGTVLYDENSKEVRICIGHKYVDNNPSEAFSAQTEETTTPAKKHKVAEKAAPVINFTGTKTGTGTASI